MAQGLWTAKSHFPVQQNSLDIQKPLPGRLYERRMLCPGAGYPATEVANHQGTV